MNLFGFEIKRKKPDFIGKANIISPSIDDGSTIIDSAAAYYGLVVDIDGVIKNENDLIRRYRESAQYVDCNSAIEEIVSEAIIADTSEHIVSLITDYITASAKIKKMFVTEFQNIIDLLNFSEKGYELFRQWYIDGRLFFQIIIDDENPKDGIVELRQIDPRKIRKIKNIKKEKTSDGLDVITDIEEYYLYNDKGITEQTTQGAKISPDSIIHVTSGLFDPNTNMGLSYLHQAIKPVNQLKMMEDALIIYRISRAPERRIFYIDVGNLPKVRAEQYVNDIMNKFRNKVVYDASTGEIKDNRQHLSIMEDFWMPRREGGKGTEITTLEGGQNLGEIEDIIYFQKKLYHTLNVPLSRLLPETTFSLGRAAEITREELKFAKFIDRLRKKFSSLFLQALRVQLIIKGIISADDWESFSNKLRIDYQRDNYYAELKEAEIYTNRSTLMQSLDMFAGKYYSIEWIRRNVLKQSTEEMKQIDLENKAAADKEAAASSEDSADGEEGGDSGGGGEFDIEM